MKQIIYIIPGFGESLKDKPYLELIKYFESKGLRVVFYQPKWKWNTIKKWLDDFQNLLEKDDTQDSVILGFSFGADIAVLSTKTHNFSKLILCSISPYFKEDIKYLPTLTEKYLGKKRMKAFQKQDFPKNTIISAIFLSGSEEKVLFPNSNRKYFDLWKGDKKYIIVLNSGHDISTPNYIKEIKDLF